MATLHLKYKKSYNPYSQDTFYQQKINCRGVYSSIIPPPPPQGGEKESKALRAREENQRRVKKKGRGRRREGEGEGKEKGGKREENKSTNLLMKKEKNMRGKEMKKVDKGTNAKKLRNFGISLIIHDRRLSGVYILK